MLLDAAMPSPAENVTDFILDNPIVLAIACAVLVAAIVLIIAIVKNNDKK